MKKKKYIRKTDKIKRPAEFYVKQAEELLISMKSRYQSASILKKKYALSRVTAIRYVTAATNLLAMRLEKAKSEHTADSYHFYVKIINDEEQRMCDRIRARESLDDLLGIKGHMASFGVPIDKMRETVALAVADALKFLANESPEIKATIARKQVELAELIDSKYGKVDLSNGRMETSKPESNTPIN